MTNNNEKTIMHISAISGLFSIKGLEVECFVSYDEMKERAYNMLYQRGLRDEHLLRNLTTIFADSYKSMVTVLENLSSDLKSIKNIFNKIGLVSNARMNLIDLAYTLKYDLDDCIRESEDSSESADYRNYKNRTVKLVYNNYKYEYLEYAKYLQKL